MKGKKIVIVIMTSITVVAILFLAPIVPINRTVYTGLPQTQPLSSMSCSLPNYPVVNPTLVYQGYESITRYFTGVGIMVYTGCYMPQ